MQNQIDKMQWLILTLLKLSKLDAGTVEFNIKSLKASEIIESSIQPFLIAADLKGIEIIKALMILFLAEMRIGLLRLCRIL